MYIYIYIYIDVSYIVTNLLAFPAPSLPPGAIQHEDRLPGHRMRFQRTEREEFHGTHRHEVQIVPPWWTEDMESMWCWNWTTKDLVWKEVKFWWFRGESWWCRDQNDDWTMMVNEDILRMWQHTRIGDLTIRNWWNGLLLRRTITCIGTEWRSIHGGAPVAKRRVA